jgi:hypothetical protein
MTNALLRGRVFQFWEYNVSHGSLLVRSPSKDEHGPNVDILCTSTTYVELPRFMPKLQIVDANPEEIAKAQKLLGRQFHGPETVRIFLVSDVLFVVVAATLHIRENIGFHSSSPFGFPQVLVPRENSTQSEKLD